MKLLDVKIIEKWLSDIETFDYSRIKDDQAREQMRVILTARHEAYCNVLCLVKG
jgi:hypothetical protein